jgi:hypothetical protein
MLLSPNEGYYDVGFATESGKISSVCQDEYENGLRIGDAVVSITRPDGQGYYYLEVERNGEAKRFRFRAVRKVSQSFRLDMDPFASTQARKNLRVWLAR